MSNTKEKFGDILDKVKHSLYEYMELEGIEIQQNNSFKCPNKITHKNDDQNASGYYKDSGEDGYPNWACHRCHEYGDTLNFAAFLHDLPIDGNGFIVETLAHVCEVLGIAMPEQDESEIDDRTKYILEARRYFKNNPLIDTSRLTSEEYGRNYPVAFAKEMIECCKFATGGGEKDNKNPILHHARPGTIMIPIIENSQIVGSIARNPKSDSNHPKYENSPMNYELGIKYNTLLNLDKAVGRAKRSNKLYIFEGVFNTYAGITLGISTMGILGTSSVNIVANKLAGTNIHEIIIVMDKDQSGIDAAVKLGKLLHDRGLNPIYYKFDKKNENIDYDNEIANDPQEFLKKIENAENKITVIEFMILYNADYMIDATLSDISKYHLLLKDISIYGSMLLVDQYAELIIKTFPKANAQKDHLAADIKNSLTDVNSPIMQRMNSLVVKTSNNVIDSRSLEQKHSYITELYDASTKLISTGTSGITTTTKRKMMDLLDNNSKQISKIYKTGFTNLDRDRADEGPELMLTDSLLVGIAGKPSHLKSTFVRFMSMYFASTYPRDVFVIYFTLDDNKRRTYTWMLSLVSRVPFRRVMNVLTYLALKNSKIEDPSTSSTFGIPSNEEIKSVLMAKETLRTTIGENLFILDKSDIATEDEIIGTTRRFLESFPKRYPIIIVDNMYNVNDISRSTDKRAAADAYIDKAKEFTTKGRCLWINTLEVRKVDGRITMNDIKETGTVDFRNDITLATFNSFKEWGQNSKMVVRDEFNRAIPIIELHTLKDKIGESRRTNFFKLNGPIGDMTSVTSREELDTYYELMRGDKGFSPNEKGSSSGNNTFKKGGSIF